MCEVSVTIPACEPVSEIARCPRSLIAIAHSAQEIRSPVESSMSISRGSGCGETSSAIAISSSVVLPRADSTATTRLPASRWATIRRAARLIRSASATDVPPNFMTTVAGTATKSTWWLFIPPVAADLASEPRGPALSAASSVSLRVGLRRWLRTFRASHRNRARSQPPIGSRIPAVDGLLEHVGEASEKRPRGLHPISNHTQPSGEKDENHDKAACRSPSLPRPAKRHQRLRIRLRRPGGCPPWCWSPSCRDLCSSDDDRSLRPETSSKLGEILRTG